MPTRIMAMDGTSSVPSFASAIVRNEAAYMTYSAFDYVTSTFAYLAYLAATARQQRHHTGWMSTKSMQAHTAHCHTRFVISSSIQ